MRSDRFAVRLKKKRLGKKLSNINQNGIDYCKRNTRMPTYNSFAAILGLTAIDTILVVGCKHASCMVARRFLCFLGPKLGLLYLSSCGCYIETTTNNSYCEVFPVAIDAIVSLIKLSQIATPVTCKESII